MRPIDIEAATVDALSAAGMRACAYPVPRDLGDSLPLIVVQRTGGENVSRVLDSHDVSFDCYAESWAAATDAANWACGAVADMEGADMGGVSCIASRLFTLPYNNPDPLRPDLPRVTFSAIVTLREI